MSERKTGSKLEGKSLEVGGLMMQDTNGGIQHLRKLVTTSPDGGIDYERVIDSDIDYTEYIKKLKERGNEAV